MKRFLLLTATMVLASCQSASDISKESSRTPKGNENAAVTLTEFGDLQCPACRAAHTGIVGPILEAYGDQISYEFKHFPLRSIHRFALDAAEASECAADQGKFWEFVDISYEKQPDLNFESLIDWATELELDVVLFERCWKSHRKRDTVLTNYQEGRNLGVSGTPSFFINGQRVETGFDTISKAIEDILGNFEQRL